MSNLYIIFDRREGEAESRVFIFPCISFRKYYEEVSIVVKVKNISDIVHVIAQTQRENSLLVYDKQEFIISSLKVLSSEFDGCYETVSITWNVISEKKLNWKKEGF